LKEASSLTTFVDELLGKRAVWDDLSPIAEVLAGTLGSADAGQATSTR
jgi:hypothetical protein